jgi:hypothetical protein
LGITARRTEDLMSSTTQKIANARGGTNESADLNWSEQLNLRHVPRFLRTDAIDAFEEGDEIGFLGVADNQLGLAIVFDNALPLKRRGMYEKALIQAFTGTRTNNLMYQLWVIDDLFREADADRLREAGDPMPGEGPFTLYRGVAGTNRTRRIAGLSWTRNIDVACWFAARLDLPSPSVYTATVQTNQVLCYVHDRHEEEFICRVKKPTILDISEDEIRERKARLIESRRIAEAQAKGAR